MRIGAETVAIVLISFLFTVAISYLWGWDVGKKDSVCYVITGD